MISHYFKRDVRDIEILRSSMKSSRHANEGLKEIYEIEITSTPPAMEKYKSSLVSGSLIKLVDSDKIGGWGGSQRIVKN